MLHIGSNENGLQGDLRDTSSDPYQEECMCISSRFAFADVVIRKRCDCHFHKYGRRKRDRLFVVRAKLCIVYFIESCLNLVRVKSSDKQVVIDVCLGFVGMANTRMCLENECCEICAINLRTMESAFLYG